MFGLPDLHVKADAGFSADVVFDLLGGGDFTIIDASATLEADECGIAQAEVVFKVLDSDIFGLVGMEELPGDLVDEETREDCAAAFGTVQTAANRTKKAYRDAVELLRQYHERVANDDGTPESFADNFPGGLCHQIAAQPPRGFPSGFCSQAAESPEATINRFIGYYERSATSFDSADGAVGLIDAVDQLADQIPSGHIPLEFFSYEDKSRQTLFAAQFLIGPIPVVLEVEATADYGVDFSGTLDFNAGSVLRSIVTSTADNAVDSLLFAKVEGAPHAGAGLAAFAGVGFGVPGFEAKIGMETSLMLAEVWVPAHAGAGVGLGAVRDERPPAADVEDFVVPGASIIPPKRFVADVRYSAGLGGMLRNVLSGSIAGKLKISVLFFSKTWRKTIFNFDGICPSTPGQRPSPNADCDFDLIKAEGSLTGASGPFEWGQIRMPFSFPKLQRLANGAHPVGTGEVDANRVDELFFDSLCTCIDPNDPDETRECFRNDDCCDATPNCFKDPNSQVSECIECRAEKETCNTNSDCCDGNVCTLDKTCQVGECYSPCKVNSDCQEGYTCLGDVGSKRCHLPNSGCVIVE